MAINDPREFVKQLFEEDDLFTIPDNVPEIPESGQMPTNKTEGNPVKLAQATYYDGGIATPREHEQIVQDYVNQGSELPILSDEIDREIGIWIQSQTGEVATPDQIQNLKDILQGRSVITEDYQALPPQGSISPYSTSDEGGIFSEDQMRSRWLGLTESPPTRGVLSDFAAKDRYQPRGSEMERERIEAEREKELLDGLERAYQRQRLLEEERRRQEEPIQPNPVPRQSPFII